MKNCSKCGELKSLSEFNKRKDSIDGTRNQCKICRNKVVNECRMSKSYDIKEYNREYKKLNKEKRRIYESNKRKISVIYKLKTNLRTLIGNSIRSKNYSKSSKTYEILGCSFEQFKLHM